MIRRAWRRLWSPVMQLVAAFAVTVFGASLIAWWAVGVVLVVAGCLAAVDALLRDEKRTGRLGSSHADVLERWRQAR